MDSRETYENEFKYLGDLSKGLTLEAITIDFKKLDEKTRGEMRDLLSRYIVKRKGEIWRNVLNGPHNNYF